MLKLRGPNQASTGFLEVTMPDSKPRFRAIPSSQTDRTYFLAVEVQVYECFSCVHADMHLWDLGTEAGAWVRHIKAQTFALPRSFLGIAGTCKC